MSLGVLQRIAATITRYYREHDYVLTQAFVPRQTVQNGIVEIRIVPGILGDVLPVGNKDYSDRMLRKAFKGLEDEPVTRSRLETALLVLRDFPGLEASGVFTRGTEPGTADLRLSVEAEDGHELFFTADDHGSEFLGEYRARVDWVWNNPIGFADQLTIGGLHTLDPENSFYGAFDYSFRAFPGDTSIPWLVGLGVSYNEFDIGQRLEALGLNGQTTRAGINISRNLVRSRTLDVALRVAFDRKRAEVLREDTALSQDDLSVLVGSLSMRTQDNGFFGQPGVTRLGFDWSGGLPDVFGAMPANGDPDSSRVSADGERAGGDFEKVNASLDRLQRLGRYVSVLARLRAQWSEDLLVSLEQFPLGGPESVRAYPLSAFLTDSGYFGSLELRLHPFASSRGWWRGISISAFADHAEGDVNEPLPSDVDNVAMSGAGLGLTVDVGGRFRFVATAARPFGERAPGFEDEDSTQYFVSMSLRL